MPMDTLYKVKKKYTYSSLVILIILGVISLWPFNETSGIIV